MWQISYSTAACSYYIRNISLLQSYKFLIKNTEKSENALVTIDFTCMIDRYLDYYTAQLQIILNVINIYI